MKPRVLLIEDDPEIAREVSEFLNQRAYDAVVAPSGSEGLAELARETYAAVVLDLCLPDCYGIDVCLEIKQSYRLPILIVSAESGEQSRIMGLQAGADDYIEKPFSLNELYIKLHKLIQLYQASPNEHKNNPKKIAFAGWELDTQLQTLVDRFGVETTLTFAEYQILKHLTLNSHQLFDREQLSEVISADQEHQGRSVDVHVSRLRDKLGQAGLIKSVRSHGYLFVGKVEGVHS